MKKRVFEVIIDNDDTFEVNMSDEYLTVNAIVDAIWEALIKKEVKPLNTLFSTVAYVLARDLTQTMEKEFIGLLSQKVQTYREDMLKNLTAEQIKKLEEIKSRQ